MKNIDIFKKQLRSNQTNAENILWYHLRNRHFQGYKFRRQVKIGRYIVDFLCHEKKLIIECDGGQHNEQDTKQKDDIRKNYLNKEGYKELRFWNNHIFENIEGVLNAIMDEINKD